MKIKHLFLLLLAFTGCKKNMKTESGNMDSIESATLTNIDTVFIEKNDGIVPKSIYLYLDSISSGSRFTDNKGKDYYYRLLFSSSEENKSLHGEKINIVGDGIVEFVKRYKIPDDIAGLKNNSFVDFIRWKSPEIIVIKILDCDVVKIMEINLSKLEANEI